MSRLKTWQLFAVCVLIWGTTWHAVTYQIGPFAAEVGVAVRFAMAGAGVLAWCRWRGVSISFGLAGHAAFALQGVTLYGLAYVCIYHAERFVASGLVAVGYSAAPLLAGVGAAMLFGAALTARFVLGGLVGLAGVALIFWPEIVRPSGQRDGALGAVLTVAAVLLSAVGSLAASRNRARGRALLPAMGWGMLYGALAALLAAGALGRSFALPGAASWWLSLAYLTLAGSVLTFVSFLTLQDRLGPGPAGTVGVMTPLLALVVSIVFESFRPDALTALGAALAVAGNMLMLHRTAYGRSRQAGMSPADRNGRLRRSWQSSGTQAAPGTEPESGLQIDAVIFEKLRAQAAPGTEPESGTGAGRSGSGMNSVSPGTFGKR